jgi:hypothetical protein
MHASMSSRATMGSSFEMLPSRYFKIWTKPYRLLASVARASITKTFPPKPSEPRGRPAFLSRAHTRVCSTG